MHPDAHNSPVYGPTVSHCHTDNNVWRPEAATLRSQSPCSVGGREPIELKSRKSSSSTVRFSSLSPPISLDGSIDLFDIQPRTTGLGQQPPTRLGLPRTATARPAKQLPRTTTAGRIPLRKKNGGKTEAISYKTTSSSSSSSSKVRVRRIGQ